MTSPIVLPQQPSGFEQGLASFLDAYKMANQQRYQQQWLQQNQQQMQLQEQAQQMQALRDRMTARNQAQAQFMQLIDTMGMDVMNDPEVMQRVQEAGLDPKGLQRQYEAGKKRKETELDLRINSFLETLPKEIRPSTKAAVDAIRNGLGLETADRIYSASLNNVTAETIAAEKLKYPWLKDLPRDAFLKAWSEMKAAEMSKGLQIGEEAERQVRMDQIRAATNRAADADDSFTVVRLIRPGLDELNRMGSPLWTQMMVNYMNDQRGNTKPWEQLSPIEREDYYLDWYLGPGYSKMWREHLRRAIRTGMEGFFNEQAQQQQTGAAMPPGWSIGRPITGGRRLF